MTNSTQARHFIQAAEERIAELSAQISSGACDDYPAYRAMCGQVLGLREAIELSEEIDKKLFGD